MDLDEFTTAINGVRLNVLLDHLPEGMIPASSPIEELTDGDGCGVLVDGVLYVLDPGLEQTYRVERLAKGLCRLHVYADGRNVGVEMFQGKV
jgi:hypothetical protein